MKKFTGMTKTIFKRAGLTAFSTQDRNDLVRFLEAEGFKVKVTTKWDEDSESFYYILTEEEEDLEEAIERVYNELKTEDYENTDEAEVMAERVIEGKDLTIEEFNYNKLSRDQKEFITGADYRTRKIEAEEIAEYHEVEGMTAILVEIFDTMAQGKSPKRKFKKWLA